MTDILRGSPVAEGINSFLRSHIAGKGITLAAVVSTDDPSMMSYPVSYTHLTLPTN